MQNKLLIGMTTALIFTTFFLGYFYGQLRTLQSGAVLGQANPSAQEALPPEDNSPLTEEEWQQVLAEPAAVRGSADAPVVMVEFTDYQCPFCARHQSDTEPQLLTEYIETGKVRHVIRDLPLPFHTMADEAAQAARCAGDQGKYFEMHDVLFETQDVWGAATGVEAFAEAASSVGLNTATFDSCMSSGKYADAVAADLELATAVGASGTPTFFINSEKLVGAQPFASFKQVIDAKL